MTQVDLSTVSEAPLSEKEEVWIQDLEDHLNPVIESSDFAYRVRFSLLQEITITDFLSTAHQENQYCESQ